MVTQYRKLFDTALGKHSSSRSTKAVDPRRLKLTSIKVKAVNCNPSKGLPLIWPDYSHMMKLPSRTDVVSHASKIRMRLYRIRTMLIGNGYYSPFFSASAAGLPVSFFLCFGLVLPWLPANILPRRERLSPFPIFIPHLMIYRCPDRRCCLKLLAWK